MLDGKIIAGIAIATTTAYVGAVILAHQPKTILQPYRPKVIAHKLNDNGQLIDYEVFY